MLSVMTQGGGMILAHGAVFTKLNGQIKSPLKIITIFTMLLSFVYDAA